MAATSHYVKQDVGAWEIVEALLNDSQFEFKDRGAYLNKGRCPSCDAKELFIKKDQPWVVVCNRLNNCGYRESTRELYPELFNQYTERYPATEVNPNATADAYMSHNRRFPLETVKAWYDQERYRIPGSGEVAETVRFYIDAGRTVYWERLIDKSKSGGQRINFGGKRKEDTTLVKGDWWMPPGQTLETGDTVYLVEGIFHAIAFHLMGHKSCALLMAGNFPSTMIKPHLDKSIKWRLALDDDAAGRKSMKSHARKLKKREQKVAFVLTGAAKDWDDLYRLNQINEWFLGEALWRGRMFGAESVTEKAWAYYAWRKRRMAVLDFGNELFSVAVSDKMQADLESHGMDIKLDEARELFASHCDIAQISNCVPSFLYCEKIALTDELFYLFNLDFSNKNPSQQIRVSGAGIENPASFNKTLLTQAAGASFDGKTLHLKLLRDAWFRKKTLHVETVSFVGYHKESACYLFQDFAFKKGREMKINKHGFFDTDKQPIKTGFKGFHIERVEDDSTAWFDDFLKVYRWNGLATLAFFFGSLFAEQIRARNKAFPFFEICGEHGTGKTTILEFCWKLLGRDDYEGFDPSKATFAARTRSFMQVSGLPVVLIESDRGEAGSGAKQKMFDFEELKTAYNGRAIRSMGVYNRGNDVEEPAFRASVIIAQNAAVDGTKALLSRIIQMEFDNKHFTEETKRLAPFFERAEVKEVGGFLRKALRSEERVLQTVFNAYPKYLKQAEASWDGVLDLRIKKTHALLLALAEALRLVIPELSEDTLHQFEGFVHQRAVSRQQALSADHPIVDGFWETFEYLNVAAMRDPDARYSDKTIEVERLNHSTDPAMIAISLKQFNQLCMENKVEMTPTIELKRYLPGSRKHKFLGQRSVRSKIIDKSIWCWCFATKEAKR